MIYFFFSSSSSFKINTFLPLLSSIRPCNSMDNGHWTMSYLFYFSFFLVQHLSYHYIRSTIVTFICMALLYLCPWQGHCCICFTVLLVTLLYLYHRCIYGTIVVMSPLKSYHFHISVTILFVYFLPRTVTRTVAERWPLFLVIFQRFFKLQTVTWVVLRYHSGTLKL